MLWRSHSLQGKSLPVTTTESMCASGLTLSFRTKNVDLNISMTCGTFKNRQLNLPRFFPHLESSDAGTCCPHQEFPMMNHIEHPAGMLFNSICAQQAIKQNKRHGLKQSWAQRSHTGFTVTSRTHVLFESQFLIRAKRTASELEDSVSTCLAWDIYGRKHNRHTEVLLFWFLGLYLWITTQLYRLVSASLWRKTLACAYLELLSSPAPPPPHLLFLLTCSSPTCSSSSSSPAHPPSLAPPPHQLLLLFLL